AHSNTSVSSPRRGPAFPPWPRPRGAAGVGRPPPAGSVPPAVSEASTPPQDLSAYEQVILDASAPRDRTRHRQQARPLGLTVDEALELQNTVKGSSVDSPPRQPGLLRDALIHLPHELTVGRPCPA